jgi:predicted AlkP superfamily pyrophosphatase or phosphodiesterase
MKKITWLLLITISLVFIDDALAGKRKVLLIGIDGVRSDVLQKLNTPAISYLAENGFGTYESWHQDITISAPSWSSILCGVYHDKHGVTDNSFKGKKYTQHPMIPLLAKQIQPSLKFGMYMEWGGLLRNSRNNGWDQMINGNLGSTEQTTIEASEWIANSDLDFYFVYYGAVDLWGHCLGFSEFNPFYINAIREADRAVGELIKSITKRIDYPQEDWLILITTDHGGKGLCHGGYSKSERQIFWIAYSDRIKKYKFAGCDLGNKNLSHNPVCSNTLRRIPVQTDITVTALHHLLYDEGCNPEDCISWYLDGRSWLAEMGMNSKKKPIDNIAVNTR